MPLFNYLINGLLLFYFSLLIWRIFSNYEKLWKQHSFLLDTICHIILMIFLYITFSLIHYEYMNLRINLSTALSVLCSCLVSLIFGISLGRSWGYAEAKSNERHDRHDNNHNVHSHERKRTIKSKNISTSSQFQNQFQNQSQNQQYQYQSVSTVLSPSSSSDLDNVISHSLSTPLQSTLNSSLSLSSSTSTTIDTQDIYDAAEVAKSNLLSILEIYQKPLIENNGNNNINNNNINNNMNGNIARNWKLARSSTISHVWISTHKSSNTLIKGSCISLLSPAATAKYFYNNNISTGLEGIMKEKETLFSFRRNRVVVSRMLCNLGTLTSAKREFYLVTYWAEMENGTIVICSRSLPESYTPHMSSSSSSSQSQSQSISSSSHSHNSHSHSHSHSKHKSYTRGFISSCGFVIQPNRLIDSTKRGCQVLYCVDIDFCSSSMGMKRQNSAKTEAIINCALEFLDQISSMIPENNTNIDSLSLSPGTLLDHAMENMNTTSETHFNNVMIQGLSHQNRIELKNISKDSINRLLSLHMSATYSNYDGNLIRNNNTLTSSSTSSSSQLGNIERKWTSFYDQDGIIISEYSGNDSPVGTLMASCHVNASPQMIKKLLVEFPEYVDTLLEKRNILCQLDELTTIQWIAYGAIWPVGATDFLVITTECAFNSNNPGRNNPHDIHDSFVIVSTSVDSIIEDEEENDNVDNVDNGDNNYNDGDNEDNNTTSTKKYNRSTLRLAGYSGTPNTAKGGTDLKLFVDVDATRYVPAWLLQILAQYGLSEMMNRIRIAAPTLANNYNNTNSDDRSPIFHPPSSKLGAILTQIQSREEKMRHYVDPSLIDIPKPLTRERKNSYSSSDSDAMKPINLSSNISTTSSTGGTSTNSTSYSTNECSSHNKDIEKGLQLGYDSQYILKLYTGILTDEKYVFDWQSKTKKNNVEVSVSPINGSAWFALKATTFISHITKYKLKDFLINDNNLSSYDDMMDRIEPLLRINDNTSIRRIMFKAIWPTASRDFLVCTTWNELDDGTILISSRSAWNELYPPEEGYVRGFLNISGYHITPSKDSEIGCHITMCAHSDLGGTLPIGIINMLAFSAPIKMLTAITALTR